MYRSLLNTAASGATLNVLMAIASFARDGVAWPSLRLIARRAKVSRTTVVAGITELRRLDEIHVERRRVRGAGGTQLVNHYTLLKVVQSVNHLTAQGGSIRNSKVVQSTEETVRRSLLLNVSEENRPPVQENAPPWLSAVQILSDPSTYPYRQDQIRELERRFDQPGQLIHGSVVSTAFAQAHRLMKEAREILEDPRRYPDPVIEILRRAAKLAISVTADTAEQLLAAA